MILTVEDLARIKAEMETYNLNADQVVELLKYHSIVKALKSYNDKLMQEVEQKINLIGGNDGPGVTQTTPKEDQKSTGGKNA
jgi:hypothetical protein